MEVTCDNLQLLQVGKTAKSRRLVQALMFVGSVRYWFLLIGLWHKAFTNKNTLYTKKKKKLHITVWKLAASNKSRSEPIHVGEFLMDLDSHARRLRHSPRLVGR